MSKKFCKASNDSMFKTIFTADYNRDMLEELIWEAIRLKVKIEYLLLPEQKKNNIRVRGKILDLIAKVKDKEINIEVNTSVYLGLNKRNAAFIFKRYSDNVAVGNSYNEMPEFIQINFTVSDTLPLVSVFTLYDKEHDSEYINNLKIYVINISKAKELCYNKKNDMKLISLLDCDEEELNRIKGDEIVERLKGEVKRLNKDKDFIDFISQEDEERLYLNTIKEDSYNQGIEQEKLSTVKNMLKEKIDINTISKITGLNINDIKKLIND